MYMEDVLTTKDQGLNAVGMLPMLFIRMMH